MSESIEAVSADEPDVKKIWRLTFLCMLGTMICSTSVILTHVGLFMVPLASEFSWGRGEISLALTAAAISMAAANPFVGRLIDNYGVGPVLIVSLCAYGLATFCLPWLVYSWSLNGLYVGFALIAAVGAGSNVIAYVRILSGWFVGPLESRRGLALGLAMAGVPLGGFLTGPSSILMIEWFGWATTFQILASFPIVIGLPVALTLILTGPKEPAVRGSDGKVSRQASLTGMSLMEAAKTRQFWLLLFSVILMAGCLQGVLIHLIPFMTDLGATPGILALLASLTAPVGVLGRVVAGYLFDRFFAPRVAVFIFGVATLAALSMSHVQFLPIALIGGMLLGFGAGAESDFIGYVIGRYFGLRNYGQIFGVIYGFFMVGIAIGPYLSGLGFDHFGDYRVTFLIAGGGLFLVCVLLAMMPRFPSSVERP